MNRRALLAVPIAASLLAIAASNNGGAKTARVMSRDQAQAVRGGAIPCYQTHWNNCVATPFNCASRGVCNWEQRNNQWNWWCNLDNVPEQYTAGYDYVLTHAVGLLLRQTWETIACLAYRDCDVNPCQAVIGGWVCRGGEIESWGDYHVPETATGGKCPPDES